MKKKLALLNMYDGYPNLGMRGIHNLLEPYSNELFIEEFDVRKEQELPDTSFNIYISSGGPGSPLEGDGLWDSKWYALIQALWEHNLNTEDPSQKKYVFFICHSFQMACHHFGLGELTERKSTSFGIYPCHKTKAGAEDWLLEGLEDPYYIVDSRSWQLIQPKKKAFKALGAKIISLEKIRTHVEYERAIMAVRFSDEFVGTQFHPEADPYGMKINFAKQKNKDFVLKNHSVRKYNNMMKYLEDPARIALTHQKIIPTFLEYAIEKLETKLKVNA